MDYDLTIKGECGEFCAVSGVFAKSEEREKAHNIGMLLSEKSECLTYMCNNQIII